MSQRPCVAVVADLIDTGGRSEQRVAEKYLVPLREQVRAEVLLVPASTAGVDVDSVLARCDGLMLTGALSNVHPQAYGAAHATAREPLDRARDAVALPLAAAAIGRRMPFLGICRGLQELNVALGGSLHPALHELPGRADHRAPADTAPARYAPVHAVSCTPGGLLARLAGSGSFMVNSLHGQGVDRCGDGLLIEAQAADGTIEALSVEGHPFALAVQWHLEWQPEANPVARAVYTAFGAALRGYRGGPAAVRPSHQLTRKPGLL